MKRFYLFWLFILRVSTTILRKKKNRPHAESVHTISGKEAKSGRVVKITCVYHDSIGQQGKRPSENIGIIGPQLFINYVSLIQCVCFYSDKIQTLCVYIIGSQEGCNDNSK